jgi:peptide-methionine (S)-S-oxide reductase
MNSIARTKLGVVLMLPVVLAGALVSIGHAADQSGGKAYFAGGCFWCMEEVFEKVPGVLSVTSGYMGGRVEHPTYEQVSAGGTGHAESVEVVYDPAKVSYTALLDAFWRNVDPVTPNAQFCDHGSQYRAVIFYLGDEEQRLGGGVESAPSSNPRDSRGGSLRS